MRLRNQATIITGHLPLMSACAHETLHIYLPSIRKVRPIFAGD